MNLSVRIFDTGNIIERTGRGTEQTGAQEQRKAVFGGGLDLAADPIAQRRREACEKAWKVVKNAWDNDKTVDAAIQGRQEHYAELAALRDETTESLADVTEDKDVLRQLYGVSKDSKEQQDLELLEKEQDFVNGVSLEAPTEEEWERLAEIKKQPLTEYQERALALNARAGDYKLQIEDLNRRMRDDIADIKSISQERLKSNPMVDAQNAAKEIMDAANEQVIGMLMQEAKEHVDEKQEEASKKAEEAMEEKEKREEQQEELKLKRAVQEAMIEGTREAVEKAKAIEREKEAPDIEITEMVDLTKSTNSAKDVGQSLDEIKSSMKLLEADLKGIKVDEEI